MGCASCGSSKDGVPSGCKSNGHCKSGGCNKLNTYDWLTMEDVVDSERYGFVEVSFKKGASKRFYQNPIANKTTTGDMVVVSADGGYDIGQISLSGELVRLQMKKRRVKEAAVNHKVTRIASERDLEKLDYARSKEYETLVRSRVIARELGLEMKVGDIEYQADAKKATFFYTADGRVDFRELIRALAKDFRIKVEMRQIGARQESSRIGGIGSCGRELCCSTWLTDYKSVSTAAARYQNLAINQAKLSGQCGRLKCCLNFELDTYMDALEDFPDKADRLETQIGTANLIKTDIFKRLMYYVIRGGENQRARFVVISVERVKEIKALNAKGEKPFDLIDEATKIEMAEAAKEEVGFDEDLTGIIDLPPEQRRKKKRRPNKNSKRRGDRPKPSGKTGQGDDKSGAKPTGDKPAAKTSNRRPSRPKRGPRKDGEGGNKPRNRGPRRNKGRNNKPNDSQNKKEE